MSPMTTPGTTATGSPSSLGVETPAGSGEHQHAAPATSDLRDLAATAVSAFFTEALGRRHDEWHRTLEWAKDTLVGLDRTCQAALTNLTENQAAPAAAASNLVDTFVATATAEAEATAQRTRADAQIEIADLQALVGRLQAELHAEREQLTTSREKFAEEHSARERAEAAWEEAQGICHQLVSAHESQVHAVQAEIEAERAEVSRLKQQLAAEQAEHARLIATLQTVQRAISFVEPLGPAPEPPRPPMHREASHDREPGHSDPDAEAERIEVRSPDAAIDATDTAVVAALPVNRTPILVDHIYRAWCRFVKAMREGHHTVFIADRSGGIVRSLTIRLRPTLIGVAGAFLLPILIGLGAGWSARTEINQLRATKTVLQVENGSYRAATHDLSAQLQSLESVINDLGVHSSLDLAAAHALRKPPAVVKARAAGGSSVLADTGLSNMLAVSLSSPEDTFGALRNLLHGLEDRLTFVRGDVERREALAAATPSIWPTHGWLTSTFGDRRDPFTGEPGFHQGLDISIEKGEPVFATADGAVEFASTAGDYGNLLVLEHGFGLSTRYGHLSGFAVKPGQRVKRGDVIGYVGSTGRSTGAHLHYEILASDRFINPLPLLTQPANQ